MNRAQWHALRNSLKGNRIWSEIFQDCLIQGGDRTIRLQEKSDAANPILFASIKRSDYNPVKPPTAKGKYQPWTSWTSPDPSGWSLHRQLCAVTPSCQQFRRKDRAAFPCSEAIKGSDLFHHLAVQAGEGCEQHTGVALRASFSGQQSLLAFEEASAEGSRLWTCAFKMILIKHQNQSSQSLFEATNSVLIQAAIQKNCQNNAGACGATGNSITHLLKQQRLLENKEKLLIRLRFQFSLEHRAINSKRQSCPLPVSVP